MSTLFAFPRNSTVHSVREVMILCIPTRLKTFHISEGHSEWVYVLSSKYKVAKLNQHLKWISHYYLMIMDGNRKRYQFYSKLCTWSILKQETFPTVLVWLPISKKCLISLQGRGARMQCCLLLGKCVALLLICNNRKSKQKDAFLIISFLCFVFVISMPFCFLSVNLALFGQYGHFSLSILGFATMS